MTDKQLEEMKARLRLMNDEGVFWPPDVAPWTVCGKMRVTGDSVKRWLKKLGWARPTPARNGFWVLTEQGKAAIGECRA